MGNNSLFFQDVECGSQNPETPKDIRCKTIDEAIETPAPEQQQIVAKETTTGVTNLTTPTAKTKPKAPPPPIVSNSNRPAGDAKLSEVPSGESDVIITTTSSIETPVPANDASKSDIAVEISKSIDPKGNETPSKRKAPSKPQPPDVTNESSDLTRDQFNAYYEPINSVAKDEHLTPDTSHVSIVTIDDNGKDVTITTTSQTDELGNDEDEGHADDSFNSFSNSSSSRSSDRGKALSGDLPPSLHSDDVVVVVKDRATAKEVIIVSNEQVSKVTPSTSDDQISIKTESSESSDGHFPFSDSNRRSVHVVHGEKKVHSVAIETMEASRKMVTPVARQKPNEQSGISSRSNTKNEIDVLTSNARTAHDLSSSTSPPVSQNNLRREASDAGSCGSFVSVNSDKENLTSADARLSPGVVLRRKKVSSG